MFTTFTATTPQVYVDVDRDKAQMLKVPVDNIFETLRIYLGSAYVNDFNMFGRTFRVTAQADGSSASPRKTSRGCRCAAPTGPMVPLGILVTFRDIAGPDRRAALQSVPRRRGAGRTQPGISSGRRCR